MAEVVCPQCNAINTGTARFCSECGTPLISAAATTSGSAEAFRSESGLQAGSVLQGRYRVISELGRGGFGAVYKAWDANLNRACALKENLATSPQAQRQFLREATVLANLSHPNLPRVTDHFFIPGQGQYLVMDFVEGGDLQSRLAQEKTVLVSDALAWVLQVLDALVYLHGRQPPVLHRDIKPANIRITSDGKAMLVDFGLVKMYDPSGQTTMGARAVTPGYAPPEQYGVGKTDVRSDIYALGATLYRMVSGEEPPESVHRLTGELLKPVQAANPQASEALGKVVERAMAMDPSRRYQTAAEFKADLQRFAGSSISTQPESIPGKVVIATVAVADASQASPALAFGVTPRTIAVGPAPASAPPPTLAVPGAPFAPAAGKRRSSGLALAIGAALFLVLLLCVGGGLIVLSSLSQLEDTSTNQTATARSEATIQARLEETAESQYATWTAKAGQFSANLGATGTALADEQTTQIAQFTQDALADAATATADAEKENAAATSTAQAAAGLPDWPVAFEESFENADAGWSTGSLADDELFNVIDVEIANSVHHIVLESKQPSYIWWNTLDAIPTESYFTLNLTTRQIGASPSGWRGLIFHKEDQSNYYIFAISDERRFTFAAWEKDRFKEIVPPTPAATIVPGEWNEISVVANGAFYSFYVNGVLVGEASDTTFTTGYGGLYFETGSDSQGEYESNSLLLLAP